MRTMDGLGLPEGSGDVAQLVERRVCNADVRGSSPLVSTKSYLEGNEPGGALVSAR
jgi:hypothetical protein